MSRGRMSGGRMSAQDGAWRRDPGSRNCAPRSEDAKAHLEPVGSSRGPGAEPAPAPPVVTQGVRADAPRGGQDAPTVKVHHVTAKVDVPRSEDARPQPVRRDVAFVS